MTASVGDARTVQRAARRHLGAPTWLVLSVLAAVAVAGPASGAAQATAGRHQAQRLVEVFSPDGSITRVAVPDVEEAPLSAAEAADLAESGLTALQETGPSTERIDLVILGDGYTADQLPLFRQHAISKWETISQTEPFTEYASYFNVWLVDVVSPESGVDNDPRPPTMRNTALDMQFWCNGTERLLCVNATKASAAAAVAPAADQILVLANSTKYGGAGGALATSSGGSAAAGLITVHELGHSLGGLADEYDYYYRAGLSEDSTQDVTIPAPYLLYAGAVQGEPGGLNITAEANPANMVNRKIKWWRWVGEASPDGGLVGSFEGGGYYRYGMYRPTQDSLMHSLGIAEGGNPFNSPSAEQMVRRFYGRVRPVEAVTPEGAVAGGSRVQVAVLQPASHDLDVRWYLDGQEVVDARGSDAFELSAEVADAHAELSVTVADTTAFVRDPAYQATELTRTLRWQV